MKTMKIYEHGLNRPKRKPHLRIIRTGLAIMAAFGVGLYLGSATPWSQAETVATDTGIIHVVNKDETLWEIAGPVADKTGQDIRALEEYRKEQETLKGGETNDVRNVSP